MKNLIILLSISTILIVGLNSCNKQKAMTTTQPERSLILGSGGGFTGAYIIYKIYNTGKIEIQNDDSKSFDYLKSIPADSAAYCFSALDELNIENYGFNHPHNMTYFIEIGSGKDANEIKWGDINHPIRKDIDIFFKRTLKMISAEYP